MNALFDIITSGRFIRQHHYNGKAFIEETERITEKRIQKAAKVSFIFKICSQTMTISNLFQICYFSNFSFFIMTRKSSSVLKTCTCYRENKKLEIDTYNSQVCCDLLLYILQIILSPAKHIILPRMCLSVCEKFS